MKIPARFLPPLLSLCAIASAFSSVEGGGTESFYVKEALVHHITPENRSSRIPLILVPGHNLSSYIYLTTPDDRAGWAQHFADAGYEVFVINDPKFDFSRGFSVAGFTEVPAESAPPANPNATQAWGQDIWRRWGFGTSEGNPYPDSQFPSESFDDFADNYPWLSSGATSSFSEAITALLKGVGPAVLLAHSAGGPQAVSAAKAHPELTAGIILVEPTGPPTEADFPTLQGIAMLGVYGDYIDSRNQGSRKTATEAAAALFAAHGGSGTIIDLPEDYGMHGNSHLMMQGKNNAFISELVLDWIDEHAAAPRNPGKPSAGGGASGGMKGGGKGKGKGGARAAGMFEGVLSQLDTDKDGSLSEAEFAKARRYQNADRGTVREAFRDADTNGDGKVSAEELFGTVAGGDRGGKGKAR